MEVSALSFSEAKKLVTDRLRTFMAELPVSERERPRYVLTDPRTGRYVTLNINNLIREVEMETDIGKAYVYSQAQYLGYTVT